VRRRSERGRQPGRSSSAARTRKRRTTNQTPSAAICAVGPRHENEGQTFSRWTGRCDAALDGGLRHCLHTDPTQRRDRLASPAWGTNGDHIKGLAPALVVTAEFDRLRDEAAAYADKLDVAGSLVEYHEVRGVDHGYNIMSDAADITRQTYSFIADQVARAVA
jgi:acetyl esterase/lipase